MERRDDVPGATGTAVSGARECSREKLRRERELGERPVVAHGDQCSDEPTGVPRDGGGAPRVRSPTGEQSGDRPPTLSVGGVAIYPFREGHLETFEAGPDIFIGVDFAAPDLAPVIAAYGDGPVGVPWDAENNRPCDYKVVAGPDNHDTSSEPGAAPVDAGEANDADGVPRRRWKHLIGVDYGVEDSSCDVDASLDTESQREKLEADH